MAVPRGKGGRGKWVRGSHKDSLSLAAPRGFVPADNEIALQGSREREWRIWGFLSCQLSPACLPACLEFSVFQMSEEEGKVMRQEENSGSRMGRR